MTPPSASRAHCLILVYNLLLGFACLLGLPFLVPLVATTAKWRRILRQRWAWGNCPWEKHKEAQRDRTVWIHALSVGEVTAAQTLIQRLNQTGRFTRIVVSCTTLTGFATARRLLPACDICYFPLDWIGPVRRMADIIDPQLVIIIETDLWPNFLHEMNRRNVLVYLANVRLSDKTFGAYRRFKPAVELLYGTLAKIAVQSERDEQRFIQLGLPRKRVQVTGNLKFDAREREPDEADLGKWRDRMGISTGERIVVAGSTHPGEEQVVLKAVEQLRQGGLICRLIIAPRDPLRTDEIIRLARHFEFTVQALGRLDIHECRPDVVVIDCLGVLGTLYGLADAAFVGGSLVAGGGHNPLEPAAWGKAVIFGPDMRDFAWIARRLTRSGAALSIGDAPALERELKNLLTDPAALQEMGRRARAVFESHKGAARRTLVFFGLEHPTGQMDPP